MPTPDTEQRVDHPLDDYGVIGDMRTLAVVGSHGAIDWMCWPRFDSPSVFGALLDDDGGRWSIEPTCPVTARRQVYLSGTNVLMTRFHAESGLVEVEDFMTLGDGGRHIVRSIRCRRGSVEMTSVISARPGFGCVEATLRPGDDGTVVLTSPAGPGDSVDAWELTASGDVDWNVDGRDVCTRFTLDEDDTVFLVLGESAIGHDSAQTAYDDTARFWRKWSERTTYAGRWRESVERSALVLKMLTHEPTGGIVAAGTASLPEVPGGERNWDYRYVWIRDAAFTVYAFIKLGHLAEADAFTSWLTARLEACAAPDADDGSPLSPIYTLDGDADIDEHTLDHWSGYAGSRPVRVGNAASDQLQLDIYGELMDALYLADKYGDGASIDTWGHIVAIIEWLSQNWQRPDDGIWETRGGRRRHTSSLLLCWVAVERAIRMARRRGRPAPLDQWCSIRDEMHATLVERGFDTAGSAFTQTLDGDTVDASILLAPLLKFISPSDPRWTATLDSVAEHLAHGPLVDRYDRTTTDDGLDGDEGSFTICSFWFVEALAISGRAEEARALFDRLLSYAGPTGIFSEQIGIDGRMMGNLPQAFTHLSLISAAIALDGALDER